MNMWHHNMTVALEPSMKPEASDSRRHGVFAAACYIHGGFTHSAPLINGFNFYDAFRSFYFYDESHDDPALYRLSDDCGVMCNPTCP